MDLNQTYYNRIDETWEGLSEKFDVPVNTLVALNNNILGETVLVSQTEVDTIRDQTPIELISTLPEETLTVIAEEHGLI